MLHPEAGLAERLTRIRLVLMDIDGTLLTAGKESFRNVILQLRGLKQLGIGFSIATGRTIQGASIVARQLQGIGSRMPPMITYNGGVVLSASDSSLIVCHRLERPAFEALVRWCRTRGLQMLAYSCQTEFDFSALETVYTEGRAGPELDFNGMPVQIVEDLLAVNNDFVAVLIEANDVSENTLLSQELASNVGDALRITNSGGRYIEVSHPSGTKLRGMIDVAKIRRITIENMMAIGDSYNDLEMIKSAGVGVSVLNAPAAVRNAADLRCTRAGAEGVVEALRVLARTLRSKVVQKTHQHHDVNVTRPNPQ
jgi:Cof subfamily protein (haloacid dehalogenase superfamily)